MASNRGQDTYSSQGTGAGYNDHTGGKFRSQYKAPPGAFWNTAQTYTAVCPGGSSGSSVTITVDAHTVFGVSQDETNAAALAMAKGIAESRLVCVNSEWDFVSGEKVFFVSGEQAEFVQPNS